MRREQSSLLAPLERKILHQLAARVPRCIHPDHLTAMGFAAMPLAGLAYYLAGSRPEFLHLVNGCIFLNWLGDSLDGTLARYRNQQRPRYGYYVDHILDCFGAVFVLAGLGLSPYMSPGIACGLIIGYLLLAANSALAAYSVGTFRISYGPFSPTELRLGAGAGNLLLLVQPTVTLSGASHRLFDLGGLAAIIIMGLMVCLSALHNGRLLYRLESKS